MKYEKKFALIKAVREIKHYAVELKFNYLERAFSNQSRSDETILEIVLRVPIKFFHPFVQTPGKNFRMG